MFFNPMIVGRNIPTCIVSTSTGEYLELIIRLLDKFSSQICAFQFCNFFNSSSSALIGDIFYP